LDLVVPQMGVSKSAAPDATSIAHERPDHDAVRAVDGPLVERVATPT
jgi:hypothetical protein